MRSLVSSLLLLVCPVAAADPRQSFAPLFYPFENGVRFASLPEGAKALKEMGYDGVGSVHGRLVEKFTKAYDEVGLRIFSTYVGGVVNGEGYRYAPSVTEAIRLLAGRDALVELYLQKGQGANDEHAVGFVREIADKAAQAKLRVVLYPHANFYVETLDDAVRVANAVGRKNVGVAFNLCHFLKVEPDADLTETLQKAKPLLWSVSICGADTDGKDWKHLIQPLDQGSFDQAALLEELRELGYNGHIGLQCFGLAERSEVHLSKSLSAWRKLSAATP